MRGEMVDIGGRRLRVVREGRDHAGPLVIFEAGAFGGSWDWALVQDLASATARTFAYDRAGLGFSEAGPRPRDSRAVVGDLRKLLAAVGEPPPYVLVAHSTAAAHGYVFALRHPEEVAGLVLVDAAPPAALAYPPVAAVARAGERLAGIAAAAGKVGAAFAARPLAGDPIDLPDPAKGEKLRFFADQSHLLWSGREMGEWLNNAEYARGLGDLDRELPVAVVTAGRGGSGRWKALQAEPARRSRSGYAVSVPGAGHASILGPRHAGAVAKAIEFIRSAAAERRPTRSSR